MNFSPLITVFIPRLFNISCQMVSLSFTVLKCKKGYSLIKSQSVIYVQYRSYTPLNLIHG